MREIAWRLGFMRVDFGQGNLVKTFVRKRKSMDGWLNEIDRLIDWLQTSFDYKAYIGTDQGSDLIRRVVLTTVQIHDRQAGEALIQGDAAADYADKAYHDTERCERLKARGIEVRILCKVWRNKPLPTWKKSFNKPVVVRAAGERPFALKKGPIASPAAVISASPATIPISSSSPRPTT
jgi:hypothetical protein